jgi:hypothetical protein
MRAFLSVGRVANAQQKAFLDKLTSKLQNRDIDPRTIGRNAFTSGQPLDKIKEEMRKAYGLIALAFERTRFPSGGVEEKPAPEAPEVLPERRYATPWHHIELAMANILGIPTFAIVERGVREEGLLEDKYGWYVYRTRLELSELDSEEFVGILDDWCARVKALRRPKIDVADLTVGELIYNLRPAQFWSVLVATLTILSTVTAVAWKSHDYFERPKPATQTSVITSASVVPAPSVSS